MAPDRLTHILTILDDDPDPCDRVERELRSILLAARLKEERRESVALAAKWKGRVLGAIAVAGAAPDSERKPRSRRPAPAR